MIVTGTQIISWAIGILGTVIANIITFLLYIGGVKIKLFQKITIHSGEKIIPIINKVDNPPQNNTQVIVSKTNNHVPHLVFNHGRVK